MQISLALLSSVLSVALAAQNILAAPSPLPLPGVDNDLDGDKQLNDGLPADIFHYMGQYSPRYLVKDDTTLVPPGCQVSAVSSLERHGARHFTSGALKNAQATLKTLKTALSPAANVPDNLRFIANYTIGTETGSLVPYGALQAYLSGKSTAKVYPGLSGRNAKLFVRSSGDEALGDDRVIVTAKYWRLGFEGKPFPSGDFSTSAQIRAAPGLTEPDVVFSELTGQNNTLDVSTCTNENNLPSSQGESGAQSRYGASTLVPTIGARLQQVIKDAGGANVTLTYSDILNIGNLCSFETLGLSTVQSGSLQLPNGKISPWCNIFNNDEWPLYGYALDVGKWTGAGYGNPYYKALGQGYIRELLARFNGKLPPALDKPTSLNSTIDGSNATFPTPPAKTIFFDGSHDNTFGLFDGPALQTSSHAEQAPHNWVFSRIAPLQGKIVFEKITCGVPNTPLPLSQDYLRIRANGAIQSPSNASWCPDAGLDPLSRLGLCKLSNVNKALDWVNTDTEWQKCFA
ncbi:phosphoglycerate mutase-like protein [Ceraceosorus guamensis]|uniref:Phytase A n=1 Tax=Ceraceosorus guamensis TaxID=1522189 RepID=A0A316W2B8_9BASI|nr:phosphoglycerate mutase-like protein [Ceraceosorus guamensis]PWN43829.1 phosphoglycerate mutase-like protein [Ceraceosorus guamensis]